MIKNKLRIQYVFISAIIGFLMAFLFALLTYLSTLSVINNKFRADVWPAWTASVLNVSFFGPIVLVLIISVYVGIKYSIKLEKTSDDNLIQSKLENHWRAAKVSFLLLVFLFIGIGYIHNIREKRLKFNQMLVEEIKPTLTQIKEISLSQEQDTFKVLVETLPPYKGKYQLIVKLKAVGYAQCEILPFVETIAMGSDKRNFEFKILASNLEKAYREELTSYVADLSEPIGIDEMIEVAVTLELYESPTVTLEKIEELTLPFSQQKALALFYFNCNEKECKIEQRMDEKE